MMKHLHRIILLAAACAALAVPASAQWKCLYATWDDNTNGTGLNTIGVGVISEDRFVALVSDGNPTESNFLIPYVNADSSQGRLYSYGYGGDAADIFETWTDGAFDQVALFNAFQIVADPQGYIYVANNDIEHNILVFKLENDTVQSAPLPSDPNSFLRTPTGSDRLWGIDLDAAGNVFVCVDTSTGLTQDLKIYPPIAQWDAFHSTAPIQTVDLPDGVYKGITVSSDGSQLFVCKYDERTILRYTGDVAGGYTRDLGFSFQMASWDTVPGSPLFLPGPISVKHLKENNILFTAATYLFPFPVSAAYDYSRIYLLNPFTGQYVSPDTNVSMINVAYWNFVRLGSYTNRGDGTRIGNASGYTSTYDVEFDESGNLYSQSYYGWTVEKWTYDGELPIVTGIEQISSTVPERFSLEQNYPNPFNPSTTIEFSLPGASHVNLRVFDLLGREVAVLVNEARTAGSYRVTFDAGNLPSGTYLYSLRAGASQEIRKMVLVQ